MVLKAIKIILHQDFANYRPATSAQYVESYPLPPYSTVIGMVHAMCEFKEYHPMMVGIQGSYFSQASDKKVIYEFNSGMKFEKDRHQLNADGFGIVRSIRDEAIITDINLIIYIIPNDQNEVDYIYQSVLNPAVFPSLGHRDDLAEIKSVELLEVQEIILEEDRIMPNDGYIPTFYNIKGGTIFHLTKNYKLRTIGNGKRAKVFRRFEKIPSNYYSKGKVIPASSKCFIDENGDLLFPG